MTGLQLHSILKFSGLHKAEIAEYLHVSGACVSSWMNRGEIEKSKGGVIIPRKAKICVLIREYCIKCVEKIEALPDVPEDLCEAEVEGIKTARRLLSKIETRSPEAYHYFEEHHDVYSTIVRNRLNRFASRYQGRKPNDGNETQTK